MKTMLRMFSVVFFVNCLFVSGAALAATTPLQDIEELLADRNYAEALTQLQTLGNTATEGQDYIAFLTGNALFYQQQYDQALTWYAKVIADYPDSAWKPKTIFQQAECYLRLKQFEQAEKIYEEEVIRLVSPERKAELAKIYLDFAEEYFSGAWVQRKEPQSIDKRPDYARAKQFYELAVAMELGAAQAESIQFQIARCSFEMADYASAISTLQHLRDTYPQGTYLTKSAYYLGQSYLQQGQFIQARQILRDLVELTPDDPHAADAAFLLSRTYRMPYPQSVEELELGVKALQEFVEMYYDDPRVAQAEYEIGLAYMSFGRYDDAIIALSAYIKKYDALQTSASSNIAPTPESAEMISLQDGVPLARFYVGQIYQQQRKFEDALAAWQVYLQHHPSHKQWSEAQRQIIETEYFIADRLFREKRYDEARAAWERFLTAHPLDERNPEIMYQIGESFVLQAQQSEEAGGTPALPENTLELYQQAIAQWQRAVSKYPETDPASQAQYQTGMIFETKLLKLEEALTAYQHVTWGSAYYDAQSRIEAMQARWLAVLTERVFRANEAPTLQITTRNIEKLTLKMYTVDLETYFRKMQTTAGVDALDIALIDPDQTWEVPVQDYQKYREFENAVTLPITVPGAYIVTCSAENTVDGGGYEATTLVLMSDLDIIVKSTKRDLLVFAQNMPAGKVFPDVKLLISDGQKIFAEGVTGSDGVWHAALEELKDVADVRVFALTSTHYAATTLATGDLQYVTGLEGRGYIYTDRPAYRPGQHVNIRGILREVDAQGVLQIPDVPGSADLRSAEEAGRMPALPGVTEKGYQIQVLSTQGNLVYQGDVALNDFGSFAVDFPLSVSAPTGDYRIVVSRGNQTYTGAFLVEQYQLQPIKLSINTERDVYFRGEMITGTISAEYYYGEPVKEKKVTYALAGIEEFSAVTDAEGNVAFTVDTRNFAESQTIMLTARLDDENVQTGKTVWLATRGFTCDVSTIRSVYLINEEIETTIKTIDPTGKPLAQPMTFGVFKRETTAYGDVAEVKVETRPVNTAADGTIKTVVRLSDGGEYILRAEGVDRFGNPVSGQTELFISGKDDEIKLRLITDKEEFKVGETPEVTLFSRAADGLGLLTYEGETILTYEILALHPDKNPLKLAMTSALAPNFTLSVAQMDGNVLHQAQKEFVVTQGLNIAIIPKPSGALRPDEYRPGDNVTVEITTTDHNGQPVPAEISLAMVDEALYAQYAETVPPIRDYFYAQRRELAAKTDSSCTFRFDAVTKVILEELLEEEERVADEKAKSIVSKKEMASGEEAIGRMSRALTEVTDMLQTQTLPSAVPPPEPELAKAGFFDADAAPADTRAAAFLAALREYFPETGYWNPGVVTDENGKATITVQLPDSTTSWRFTSRGITQETLVGETTAGIRTKLPFFAEIKTPQVFTEGDKATILTSIHNNTDGQPMVQTAFTAMMDDTVLERQEASVQANAHSVMEQSYQLDLSQISQMGSLSPVTLELEVAADTLQDRIQREAALRLYGSEYVATSSGTLRDDRQIKISLPADHTYVYREMSLLLNPATDRTLLDLTNDVPWHWKAPSSSTIHEAMVVLNAITFLNHPLPPPNLGGERGGQGGVGTPADHPLPPPNLGGERGGQGGVGTPADHSLPPPNLGGERGGVELRHLQSRFTALLTEIALRQNDDGGWNWTGKGDRSDVFVSADAVLILNAAHRQGYPLQPDVLRKGVNYLKQAFQSAQDNEIKIALLYALALAGDADFAHVNRVYRERNNLHTAGLALLSLASATMNRPEIAAEILALLENRAQRQTNAATGQSTVYWPSDAVYPYLQGDVDTTALTVLAFQKANPQHALIPEALAWLDTQRQWIGWGAMRTNARVSFALLEHLTRTQFAAQRYNLDIAVNGKPVQKLTVDSAQGQTVLQIPADLLKDANNTVSFTFDGRGELNYVAVLKGVSRDVRKTQNQYEVWRYYQPAPLVFKGQEIPSGFSVLDGAYSTWWNKVTQIPLGGFGRVTLQYSRLTYEQNDPYRNHWLILEEPLPAGCTVLAQSIHGDFMDYDVGEGKIVFYLNNSWSGTISYNLYGYLPGDYRVLPTKIQAAYQPALLDYGEPYQLSVLGRAQAVTETYRKTPDELYYYGKALFDAKQYADARALLKELFEQYRLRSDPYKDTARMLLYIAMADKNAREMVQYFEILKEKYPDLVLTFDDIIKVGQAYRAIGEYERATQVFKATAEASFLKDVQVSGALEGQGEFLASVDYTRGILNVYPDLPTIETTFYAIAQLLYTEAGRSGNLKLETGKPARETFLNQAIAMLRQFLVLYPEQPIVDEVSFSLANAYFDLEDFPAVIQAAQRFQQRYPKSQYLSGYQYIEGYAHFELEQYDDALRLCQMVATGQYPDKQGRMGESPHKQLALYIMGQIYHSLGQPAQAIAEYEKVKDQFSDAKEAVAYFTRKQLALDEVTTFRLSDPAQVKLRYRNVNEVNLLVYRVDLMKLYLLQKNLNNITSVNLAGITPYHQQTITLDTGKDYAEHEYSASLPLKEAGAYLVVAKEAEVDASGMVLMSTLKLDVEEDAVSGRVRVNVVNAETGRYENKAHVKVIGSGDAKFISGDTDLRGLFIADNIHGAATVIARKGDQYAFYRGETMLQPIPATIEMPRQEAGNMRSQAMQQLREDNIAIQQQNEQFLRQNLYQNKQDGVQVQSAY